MTDRGIRSVAALGRLLQPHYPGLSDVQLGRIVNKVPERLNIHLLSALCQALGCLPSDLLRWEGEEQPRSSRAKSKIAKPAADAARAERLRGPKFTVFRPSDAASAETPDSKAPKEAVA